MIEEQEKVAIEICSRSSYPMLTDAVVLCRLEGSTSVQRLFELHEALLARWFERRDNILNWWT